MGTATRRRLTAAERRERAARRRDRRVRRHRLPRHLDRGRSPSGPASRSRTSSACSARRRTSSSPASTAASTGRSRSFREAVADPPDDCETPRQAMGHAYIENARRPRARPLPAPDLRRGRRPRRPRAGRAAASRSWSPRRPSSAGFDEEERVRFVAQGMLLNVIAAARPAGRGVGVPQRGFLGLGLERRRPAREPAGRGRRAAGPRRARHRVVVDLRHRPRRRDARPAVVPQRLRRGSRRTSGRRSCSTRARRVERELGREPGGAAPRPAADRRRRAAARRRRAQLRPAQPAARAGAGPPLRADPAARAGLRPRRCPTAAGSATRSPQLPLDEGVRREGAQLSVPGGIEPG